MNELSLQAGSGKYLVQLHALRCGEDVSVCIYGGERPHIGAVAVAVPRKSLTGDDSNSASASVICIPGHKEDELARLIALRLSARWQCIATVSAGIHIDHAGPEDLATLNQLIEELVKQLLTWHNPLT
jgi:hypothetical protein